MSKRVWSGVFAAIFSAAVGVATAQESQAPSSSAAPGKSMTLTGCIQKADAGTAGTTGTAGAGAEQFVLKNAAASPSAAGTAGTTGTAATGAPAAAVASEYLLDGDAAKLSPHVGHKVEIMGTAKPAASASTSTGSASASAKLKVDSVKMVSATCP